MGAAKTNKPNTTTNSLIFFGLFSFNKERKEPKKAIIYLLTFYCETNTQHPSSSRVISFLFMVWMAAGVEDQIKIDGKHLSKVTHKGSTQQREGEGEGSQEVPVNKASKFRDGGLETLCGECGDGKDRQGGIDAADGAFGHLVDKVVRVVSRTRDVNLVGQYYGRPAAHPRLVVLQFLQEGVELPQRLLRAVPTHIQHIA